MALFDSAKRIDRWPMSAILNLDRLKHLIQNYKYEYFHLLFDLNVVDATYNKTASIGIAGAL